MDLDQTFVLTDKISTIAHYDPLLLIDPALRGSEVQEVETYNLSGDMVLPGEGQGLRGLKKKKTTKKKKAPKKGKGSGKGKRRRKNL